MKSTKWKALRSGVGIAAFVAFATSLTCSTEAQTPVRAARSDVMMDNPGEGIAKRINMGVGKSIIIDLPRDASEIFVANPTVANAVVRSARKLYVIAMSGGQTTIVATDAQGRQIATIEISIGRDIQELDRILKAAMPNSNVVLRTVNDTIILTGSVESAGDAQKALDIATGFTNSAAAAAAPAAPSGSSGGSSAAPAAA